MCDIESKQAELYHCFVTAYTNTILYFCCFQSKHLGQLIVIISYIEYDRFNVVLTIKVLATYNM